MGDLLGSPRVAPQTFANFFGSPVVPTFQRAGLGIRCSRAQSRVWFRFKRNAGFRSSFVGRAPQRRRSLGPGRGTVASSDVFSQTLEGAIIPALMHLIPSEFRS